MNLDNEAARDQADFLHHCYRDRSVTINPIVDWTTADVWEFLHHYGCEGNPLYQCGEDRIGCVGCPIAGTRQQERDFAKYPKYKLNYIKAFDRMMQVRKAEGKVSDWQNGADVFRWWIGDNTDPNQLSFFDDGEVLDILHEMR
jgi:phosphoadenosine phosphosulfate reductase